MSQVSLECEKLGLSERLIDHAKLTLCLSLIQGRNSNIWNGWYGLFPVPGLYLYPHPYSYVYTPLITPLRHSFLSALPRNQTSPPNAHYEFQNTLLPRAPPLYGFAFRE